MNVMAQNSMLRPGISGRVSTVIDHLDDLHFDRLENFVNISADKEVEEVNFV